MYRGSAQFVFFNIQLMHSFEVNIGICSTLEADFPFEHNFQGLTKMLTCNRKRMHQLFCYMTHTYTL